MTENAQKRIAVLLDERHTHIPLTEDQPIVSCQLLNATDGVGYKATGPDVWVSVYEFKSRVHLQAARCLLKTALPREKLLVREVDMGDLLFFAYTNPVDKTPLPNHPINSLCSAFAGEA